jgi:stage II sporulation protein D
VYHADCGGRTSAAIDVWGASSPPYLRSVADDGPAAAAHSAWRYDVDRDAVRRALNADSRTAVGAHLAAMTVAARDPSGRVQRLSLKGDTDRLVRGTDFREVLTNAFGPRAVRSTLFDVEAAGDTFTFTGSGFGHGVGLCQAGAFARVAAGLDPRTVLEFYFPGTNLLKLR